ncbi:MAG: helix-turn-helix domain-containing protein [Promethearchaeota archaeon]
MADTIFAPQVESLKVLEGLEHTNHAGKIHSRLKIDRNHVYNILRRLVKEGLVRKQAYSGTPLPGGQKVTYILTCKGMATLEYMKQALMDLFDPGQSTPPGKGQMPREDMEIEADYALQQFIEDKYDRELAVKAVVKAVRIRDDE